MPSSTRLPIRFQARAAALLVLLTTSAPGAPPSPARQAELRALLHQDCGSCHGMRLTGGLGPALTPQALAGKPAELLALVIRDGRAGTPMPPWAPLLSETDIAWLVQEMLHPEKEP
ncbi:MAG TPA: cytochrome c [Gammaproteobacteria bacterium]|nr:cytochrome c [Gammaproteobacteria bacterium]